MRIVIPTFRRLDRQRTLAALHPNIRREVILVVRNEEYHEHALRYEGEVRQVWAMEGHVDDLCKTRRWVWDTFAPLGRFVSMDDDLRGFQRRAPDGRYDTVTSEADQRAMLSDLEDLLDAGAGVASPAGRWNPPRRGGDIVSAAPLDGFYALDGPRLHPLGVRWDRVPYAQDFDFLMQVLGHGIDTVFDQSWAFLAGLSGDGRGGQSEGITWGEKSRRSKEALGSLAGLWPGYVTPARTASGWRVHRARLLSDSRRRLNMTQECTACGQAVEERLADGACQRCRDVLDLVGGDPEVLRRLARWIRPAADPASPEVTGAPRRRRGRPPLGRNHPVLAKMRGKGPFRADQVSDLYSTRGSASVSLASLTKKGLLRRLGMGLYEVVEPTHEPLNVILDGLDRPLT